MKHLSRRQFLATSAATGALAAAPALLLPARPAAASSYATITAGTRVIEVNGRAATVFGLTQPNGGHGLVMNAGERLRVRLDNRTGEDTLIHWHGLTPPSRQDGVAGISQDPIPAGGSYDYDFAVGIPGTNWMHSHLRLQEQRLLAAPLIVRDPAEAGEDVQEVVVLFHDFTFRDPEEILAELRQGGHGAAPTVGLSSGGHGGHGAPAEAATVHGAHGMQGAQAQPAPTAVAAHLQDVKYDALLANDRTLADPEVFRVDQGGRVRLRLINGAASTNMWIDLDSLRGRLIAVDGMPVRPVEESRFEFAVAQRLDILIDIPRENAAWPIFATKEGGRDRTGVVLATSGAKISALAAAADADFPAVGVDLERRLQAANPLQDRPADRQHTMMLGEATGYVWTLDGKVHGDDSPLPVSEGERFELTFMNHSTMSHPMHLHGHHFQVVAVNGSRIVGSLRDTVLVPATGTVAVAFDARNPGNWALHCHHLYHMAGGMMTSVRYT
ncbi:multicopper oxidase family protein [Mesorhizobium delmotii]|uniref:Potential multicopper oxidase n=1 Tax=Mesorhizobium delmotii TaxID=1631247 RepID=A0A2P9ARC2_9HYPH|nr:multicopper oxidase family protein [Mesorhizobium delmotii]SJM33712.1 Potential multicopper oxidase [Mesorhizobium delmotii]